MIKTLVRAFIIGIASLLLPLSFAAAQTLPAICSVQPDISPGASGNSVSVLQSFLASEGYLNEASSGYFDASTETALVAFQNATGITAEAGGNGIFGTFTQAYIAAHFCTGTSSSTPIPTATLTDLVATPTSGAAPLTVTFTDVGTSISFGDGSTQVSNNGSVIGSVSHTYTAAGNFSAVSGNSTVVISVAGASGTGSTQTPSASMSAPNNSGPAPLSVTFYISCTQGSGYDVIFGDGSDLGSSGVSQSQCNGSLQAVTHTYQTQGSYTAQLEVFVAQSNGSLAPVSVDSIGINVAAPISSSSSSSGSSSTGSSSATVPASTPGCVALLNSDLVENDTDATDNGDVSRLQEFLSLYPSVYPAALVTGFYGPLTAEAVAAFQSTYGHAPQCTSLGFTATPSSGTAPLSVTLSANNLSELYSLNFGDSSTGNFTAVTATGTNTTYSATHTYANAGTYYPEIEFGTTTQSAVAIAEVDVAAGSSSGSGSGSGSTNPSTCVPTQTLQMGQTDNNTNGNVSVLQRFLVSQGYLIVPAGATGGFFGSLTQAAVVAFQNQYGIQPTGIVGQYTLNAISSVCNGNGSTGKAPFTFTGSVSGATATFTLSGVSNNTSVTHVVAFGDNTNSQMTYQGSNGSTGTWTVSHTYAQPGTYTATLLVQTNICGGVQAYGCVSDLQTGSTVVTVSSGSAVPASPASGSGAACQEVSGGSCQGAGGTYPNYSAETLTDISGNSGVFGVNNEVLFSCVNGVWMCGGSSCSTAIDIGDTAANGYQTAVDYTQGGSYMYSSTSGLTMCTAN